MPTTVAIPDVGDVEFPDSMDEAAITDAIKTKIRPQDSEPHGSLSGSQPLPPGTSEPRADIPTLSESDPRFADVSTAVQTGQAVLENALLPSKLDWRNQLPYEELHRQASVADATAKIAQERAYKIDPFNFGEKFRATQDAARLADRAAPMTAFAESHKPISEDERITRNIAEVSQKLLEADRAAGKEPPLGVTTLSRWAGGLLNQLAAAPDTLAPSGLGGAGDELRSLGSGLQQYSEVKSGAAGAIERGAGDALSIAAGNPAGNLGLLAATLRGAMQTHSEVLQQTGSPSEADAAALATYPQLGLYMLGGSLAGKAGKALLPADSRPMVQGLAAFASSAAANIGTSAVLHMANDQPYGLQALTVDTLMALVHAHNEYGNATTEARTAAKDELLARGWSEEQIAQPFEAGKVTPATMLVPGESPELTQLRKTADQLRNADFQSDANRADLAKTEGRISELEQQDAQTNQFQPIQQDVAKSTEDVAALTGAPAPGESPPAEISVHDIVPAIPAGDEAVRGNKGDEHQDILNRLKENDVPKFIAALDTFGKGNFFMGPNGEKSSRQELQDRFGVSDSQHLRELQARTPEPAPAFSESKSEGPGAAAITEAKPQTVIGAYNAKVDEQRAARGLPLLMSEARKADQTTWDNTEKAIEANPLYPERLTEQILSGEKKAASDEEQTALLWRMIDLRNKRDTELQRADAADTPEGDKVEARLNAEQHERQLQRTEEADRKSGTAQGRALRIRRLLANEDYTPAGIEQKRRVASKAPLTADQLKSIKAEAANIQKLGELSDTAEKTAQDKQRTTAVDTAIADIEREARKNPEFTPEVKSIAERIIARLDRAADAALKRWRAKMGQANAGVDPTILGDAIIIGAAKIGKGFVKFGQWATEMVSTLGDAIKPHLEDVWNAATKHVDDNVSAAPPKLRDKVKAAITKSGTAEFEKGITEKMKARVGAGEKLQDLGAYINKLVESLVRGGVKDREQLVDRVHAALKAIDPAITRDETLDAVAGYGNFKPLNKEPIKAEVRDLKGQLQQVAKLRDIMARKPLKRSGVEQREPSDTERRLKADVLEAARRYGIVVTDPATQLKSALDAIATRLSNQIKDLTHQIDTGEKPAAKTPAPTDARIEGLTALRDRVKATWTSIFGKPTVSEAAKIKTAVKALESQVADLQDRINREETARQPKSKALTSPELEALRAQRDALNAQMEELRTLDPAFQASEEQRTLAAYKSRLATRTAELEAKNAAGDFTKKPPRAPLKLDPQAMAARARYERAKEAADRGTEALRLKNRPLYEKVLDATVKWTRAGVLSGISTLEKLTSAAILRVAFMIPEEMIGSVVRRIVPSIASRAPVEGAGFEPGLEARAIIEGVKKGFWDAGKIIKTGKSDLDAVYGQKDIAPSSFLHFFGHVHSALKSTTKRIFFIRSLEKRMNFAAKQGVDISDPFVQMQLATAAYADAQRSIFMQDNRLVDMFQAAVARGNAIDKATGRANPGGKLAATAARILVPVVKIPANIVSETLGGYALGLPFGAARALHAIFRKGAENLTPNQADSIMRMLKKGSLGGSLLLLGYFNSQNVGGYYAPGQKKKEGEPGFGDLEVAGTKIPRVLVHNPLLETLQIGATIRHVADSKLSKKDRDNEGTMTGIGRALLGISEQVPFIGETLHLGDLREAHGGDKMIGNTLKTVLEPQIMQQIANYLDKNAKGETVKRQQKTIGDVLKSGVPWMRETLPVKK